MKTSKPQSESGNAFIIVLIAVVMFAALSFTVSKGMRSDNTAKLSAREVELAASDIINYAAEMERAINRMRRNGVSESEIDFINDVDSAYTNANCITDECKVFHPDGGNMKWRTPPTGANNGNDWRYNARNVVTDVGNTCFGSTRCTELIMILNYVDLDVCQELNKKLGISPTTPPIDGNNNISSAQKHTGNFGANDSIGADTGGIIDGKTSLCIQSSAPGTYSFYHVLIAR